MKGSVHIFQTQQRAGMLLKSWQKIRLLSARMARLSD